MLAAYNDIASGLHANPFEILGRHQDGKSALLRTFAPGADRVELLSPRGKTAIAELTKVHDSGLFEISIAPSKLKAGHRYRAWFGDLPHIEQDPYSFPPSIPDMDLYLLSQGTHAHAFRYLGAHVTEQAGVKGTRFAVWAPNARSVCIAADFNLWSDTKHPMATRGGSGIWELFVPDIGDGAIYKFVLRDQSGRLLPFKADPFGFGAEMRPESASVVWDLSAYSWSDHDWLAERWKRHERDEPISIYEAHLGSWKRKDGNGYLSYAELWTPFMTRDLASFWIGCRVISHRMNTASRTFLAGRISLGRAARRCCGLNAISGLLTRGRRMDSKFGRQ